MIRTYLAAKGGAMPSARAFVPTGSSQQAVSPVPASIAIAVERIIRPIVEGQVRSFANDHPEVVQAINWFKPRKDKRQTFINSVSKRIIRDLLCDETLVRLETAFAAISGDEVVNAFSVDTSGEAGLSFKTVRGEGGVELIPAPPAAQGDAP